MRPSILLTRPEDSAARFAGQVRARFGPGLTIVTAPVLRIVRTGQHPELHKYQALIFTSAQAVPYGRAGMRCYTVGDATARAARDAGMRPISAGADAQALIRRILADAPAGPLLHLRGDQTRGAIAQTLTQAGIPTRDCVVYEQQPRPLTDQALALLGGSSPVIVPLFSPRSAQVFAQQVQGRAPLWVVAISPAAAQQAEILAPARMVIAQMPDAQAMLAAIEGLIDAGSSLEA